MNRFNGKAENFLIFPQSETWNHKAEKLVAFENFAKSGVPTITSNDNF